MAKSILILIGMNVIWSGSYVAVKLGLASMPPLTLIFWRMGISAAILILWIIIRRIPLCLDMKGVIRMVVLGVIIAGSHILWVTGLKYTNASDASLLYTFEPIWGVILASIFLKERFRMAMGVGLVFSLTGLVILSDISLSTIDQLFMASVALGNLLVVAGLFFESMFSVIAKPLADRYQAIVVIAGALLITEMVLAVPVALNGGFVFPVNVGTVGILLYLSVPCTVIGFVLWVKIMQHLPVNVMCYTIFVQPLAGPIIASIALGEILNGRIVSGGAFLLAGVCIAVGSHIRAHRAMQYFPVSSTAVTESD